MLMLQWFRASTGSSHARNKSRGWQNSTYHLSCEWISSGQDYLDKRWVKVMNRNYFDLPGYFQPGKCWCLVSVWRCLPTVPLWSNLSREVMMEDTLVQPPIDEDWLLPELPMLKLLVGFISPELSLLGCYWKFKTKICWKVSKRDKNLWTLL